GSPSDFSKADRAPTSPDLPMRNAAATRTRKSEPVARSRYALEISRRVSCAGDIGAAANTRSIATTAESRWNIAPTSPEGSSGPPHRIPQPTPRQTHTKDQRSRLVRSSAVRGYSSEEYSDVPPERLRDLRVRRNASLVQFGRLVSQITESAQG